MPKLGDIWANVIAGLIILGLTIVGSLLLSLFDASIPLWVLLPVAGLALVGGFFLGRDIGARRSLPRDHSNHLAEIILTLQKMQAGGLDDVSLEDFIERGILGPARFVLTYVPGEEIRLSVLVPDEAGSTFSMAYETGHGVGRKNDFSLDVAGSFAGRALSSGKLEWTGDVNKDDRWTKHPRARPQRDYRSLAAMPIVRGEEIVGVLSVLSTVPGAFTKGDLTYIELMGTVIGLAMVLTADPPSPASRLPKPSSEGA